MPDKCANDPNRECDVRQMVKQVERDLNSLRSQNAETHERFGERIGDLEAHNKVQDVEVKNIIKSIDNMSSDLKEMKLETKQIPLIASQVSAIHEGHKSNVAEVDKLKGKSGETWEYIKRQGLGWAIALILAIVAAAMGLSKYL